MQFIFCGQEVVTEMEKSMTRYIRGYEFIATHTDSVQICYHYASGELRSITHVVRREDILNLYGDDA